MFLWSSCSLTFTLKLPSQNPTCLLQVFASCSHSSHEEAEKEKGKACSFLLRTWPGGSYYLCLSPSGRTQRVAITSCKEAQEISSLVTCAQIKLLLPWQVDRRDTRCSSSPLIPSLLHHRSWLVELAWMSTEKGGEDEHQALEIGCLIWEEMEGAWRERW